MSPMALRSRELQYLCIVCSIVTSACLSITSSGTFEINTEVNFTCVHDSYTSSHRWKVDTADVLICVSLTCVPNVSNPTRFSFVSNPGNGVFVFTIDPVMRLDDNSIIGCHNGSIEETLKLEVRDPADSQRITSDGLSKGAIAGICVGAIVVVALVLCAYTLYILASPMKLSFQENENNDELPYVSWIPGCCGKCPKTLRLRIEKVQDNYNNTENTTGIVPYSKQSEILDVKCYRQFYIYAKNETGEICKPIKGIEPSTRYKMTLCAKIKRFPLKTKELNFRTCDKPDPPKDFRFNENINSYELPYVSWVPGFNGGCLQTFILKFQTPNQTNKRRGKPKENVHVQEITNTTAPELNKPIDEEHAEVLDLKSKKEFTIQSDNLTTIFKKVKGLEPSSQYEIKLYGKNKYGDSEVKTLLAKTHDKPDPPKDFMFNENISSYELSYVSWVPGFDGGCPQTFILQFETPNQTNTGRGKPTVYKENFHDQEITNTTAAEINKLKIDEGHAEILDVESNNIFAITSNNVTTTIRMQVKGLEPSSQYEIKLYGENKYGKTEVKTLHEKTHDKPNPPEKFKFNQNKSNVSWVPGYDGGCYQTFILQFEKQPPKTEIKTLYQAKEITNTTAAELNKPKIVEGHSEILDVESDKKFAIPSHNVTTTIRMQIKGLEPSSLYEIKLYGKNKYGKSEVKTLHAKTHGKPDPPKKFEFYENINNDEKPYVSWEPGLNGGCDQTFILRFEKILNKTHNQADTARDKPMPIEFVEGHFKILNVESNHIFSITSHKETAEILLLIKGREPSSTYKIMLYSENAYGQSKEMTLYADAADGSSLSYRHTNQPKHDKTLQRHGLSV